MPVKGELVKEEDIDKELENLPSFWSSMVAPIVTILLLAFRPAFGIGIDPLIALPVGGIVGVFAIKKNRINFQKG